MNYNPFPHTLKKRVQLIKHCWRRLKNDLAGLMTWRWWDWVIEQE